MSLHTEIHFENDIWQHLESELKDAIIAALDAHTDLSTATLNDKLIQQGLLALQLGPMGLYEKLKKSA